MKSLKEDLEAVKLILSKLDSGELSMNELSGLTDLARSIYERSVILKYKSFEAKSANQTESASQITEQEVEPVKEPEQTEPITEEVEEETNFDFSIFDEQEELIPEELEKVEEPEAEEHRSITVKEEIEGDTKKTEIEIHETKTVSFTERINMEDNSLASKFAGGKLDSLVGAFGLNERLRFINNLFEGSSELFSESIKKLDSLENLEQAMTRINEIAAEHSWDEEDDAVHDFMVYISRRYA